MTRAQRLAKTSAFCAVALGLALISAATATVTSAAENAPMQLEAKIPLGNVAGRIDHLAIDGKRQHLFIAELGNNTVGAVDLAKRAVIHRMTGLSEPQGVAYLEAQDTIYVANAGDGSVHLYNGADFAERGRIALGSDADNIRFDAKDARLVVGYGSGALSVIDPATGKGVANYALKAHPESFQIDTSGNRIFINLPEARAIAVLERSSGKLLVQWPMKYVANFAMALDRDQPRLFSVFRKPTKLVGYATDTGKVLAEADTCGDADDLFIDARRQRIYVICGEGFVDVFDARDKLRRLARVPTVEGARTGLFVPERDRLYVAARARGSEPATLWVFQPAP
jgi:DNA-binding beta-propeller fold protein YncE